MSILDRMILKGSQTNGGIMFDSFVHSEQIMEFLSRTGLQELARRHNEIMSNRTIDLVSIECFGTIDRGVVVVSSSAMGTIATCQRIHAESASRMRNVAFSNATEEQLLSVILFLKLCYEVSQEDSEGRFRNWLDICIKSARDALKSKL